MSDCFAFEITVSDGFILQEECLNMPLDAAARLLKTKRRRRYTSALRDNDTAMLTRHFFICPHCRRRTPAYPRFIMFRKDIPSAVTRCTVTTWADPQLSVFEKENTVLCLNKPLTDQHFFSCPHCGISSYPASESHHINISNRRDCITLSHTTFSLDTLYAMLPDEDCGLSFLLPVTESAVFDFFLGKVFLRITDNRGTQLCSRDITSIPSIWGRSTLYRLLCNNSLVQRRLRRLFACHMSFPFLNCELTALHFVAATRFQGFSRSFYDSIPYTVKTGHLDESFDSVSAALKCAADIPSLYKKSRLPQMKSIKKCFFANTGFFFYLSEAVFLWNTIKDPNLFRTLLVSPGIYRLFAFLHQFPGTTVFFGDYAERHGKKSLTDLLVNLSDTVKQFAIQYSAMNTAARNHEPFLFERHDNIPGYVLPLAYSVPVHSPARRFIHNTSIDGYCFDCLRSTRDYTFAGQALNNCLNASYPQDNTVICIKRNSEIIAAIEVNGDTVLQARTHGNADIDKSPAIYKAFKKWMRHNSLRISLESADA